MFLILYHYFFNVLAVCFFGPSRTPVPTALAFVCAGCPLRIASAEIIVSVRRGDLRSPAGEHSSPLRCLLFI